MRSADIIARLTAIDAQFAGVKLPPSERVEWDRLVSHLTIPMQDLRAVALHGPCRCGRSSLVDDVHLASCPHARYSKSGLVLMRY